MEDHERSQKRPIPKMLEYRESTPTGLGHYTEAIQQLGLK